MSNYRNPELILETSDLEAGEVHWRSPSNIALVKYWGKHGDQLPRNASLSFTLDFASTTTRIAYEERSKSATEDVELSFFFEGASQPAFEKRIRTYMTRLLDVFPFLRQLKLTVHSENSFPHSTGIASSASAMSALALCLCTLEHELFGDLPDDDAFRQKASYVARLGSGSAARSIYAKAAFWGKHGEVEGSSDTYAVSLENHLHDIFTTYHNDILIVDDHEKAVSSRAGHALMETHPFADSRFASANQRVHNMLSVLQSGDLEEFIRITETEALTLHGLMMASNPSYILLKPNTLAVIEKIQAFRRESNIPVCFTLDAGPNPHILYPSSYINEVQAFIKDQLLPHSKSLLQDRVGEGPVQL